MSDRTQDIQGIVHIQRRKGKWWFEVHVPNWVVEDCITDIDNGAKWYGWTHSLDHDSGVGTVEFILSAESMYADIPLTTDESEATE